MGAHANFYNSINNDRNYDSTSFEEWLTPFFKNGVFHGQLQVIANDDMSISVNSGYAYINGKNKKFDEITKLNIDAAHSNLSRIDNIVVRRNDVERDFNILVQKGNFSSIPTAPQPKRDEGIYDLIIAQILINPASIKITQENIKDTRMDLQKCGYVVSNINEIDFSQISIQFESYLDEYKRNKLLEFNSWFQSIQNTLSGDVAGNLNNKILNVENEFLNHKKITTERFKEIQNKYYDNLEIIASNIISSTDYSHYLFETTVNSSVLHGLICKQSDKAEFIMKPQSKDYVDEIMVETKNNEIKLYFVSKPKINLFFEVFITRGES